MLWSFLLLLNHGQIIICLTGTIAALLQEIVNIYPVINPPNLTVS